MCSVSWWNDLFQSFDCQIELVIISLDKTKKQSQVTHISYEFCLSVTDPVLLLVHSLGNPGLPSFLLACGPAQLDSAMTCLLLPARGCAPKGLEPCLLRPVSASNTVKGQ